VDRLKQAGEKGSKLAKKKSNKLQRPDARLTTHHDDGTQSAEILAWEEAHKDEPEAMQILSEHNYFYNRFVAKESDRAAAVLTPAYIDTLLEQLLRQYLRDSASTDRLFDADRGIATFSAKIDMTHALGLINDEAASDLHRVRKVRNQFAHSVNLHSSGDGLVSDLLCTHVVEMWGPSARTWNGRQRSI
jgi:hypothetical protein